MTKQRALTIAGLLVAVVSMTNTGATADDGRSEYAKVETYRQVLVVEGATDVPQLAAVYDNHRWGLSTRWDDSNPNALNIRRKMLENGIRGTFYLNSRKPEEQKGSLAYTLTGKGECSIGGHSVSHPRLPELPVNEAFYELMANRIALECLTDRPVNSLAFPYGAYQDKDRPAVFEGISEAVLRTRYLHCVYAGFVLGNRFLPKNVISTGLQVVPGDRQVDADKFWKQIEKVRDNEAQSRKTSDCIFLGVHPWQVGDELERLGQVMGELKDWDDFWHCTQTEYAAFAKQRRNTTVESLGAGKYAIVRPCGFELGNNVPLTLVFDGDSIRSAKADGADCEVRQADGKTIVNVPHGPRSGAPVKIDEMSEKGSKKFPGLKASVTFVPESGKVTYRLENAGKTALTDLALTVSVPPAFAPGLLRRDRNELAAGEQWSVTADVSRVRTGDYWHGGHYYAAAQVDFASNGQRGRLFATCRAAE